MAREYAQLHHSMWKPGDFRDLSPMAKLLYVTLMSQPEISQCGLLPLNANRWKTITGMSLKDVSASLDELVEQRFVITDEEEAEVLIRTFVKWDNGFGSPTRLRGIWKAITTVSSSAIRTALRDECERLGISWGYTAKDGGYVELGDPFGDIPDTPVDTPLDTPTDTPSDTAATRYAIPCGSGSGNGSGNGSGSGTRARKNSDEYSEPFERFWEVYPRKTAKGAAAKAFEDARKRAGSAQQLVDAARSFAADPNLPDAAYVPHASTWLNQSRYLDGSLPARADGKPSWDDNVAAWGNLRSPDLRAVES